VSKRGPSLVGRVIGRLTVVSLSDKKLQGGAVFYNCECKCGNAVVVLSSNLTKKTPKKSCGCLQRDVSKARCIKLNMNAIAHYIVDEDFD
jgi:hypothetical protein